jgi:hypothetical protein
MMTRQARYSRRDHGIRHPHDLGNRACSIPKHQNAHQPINRASRHLAGALRSGVVAWGTDVIPAGPRTGWVLNISSGVPNTPRAGYGGDQPGGPRKTAMKLHLGLECVQCLDRVFAGRDSMARLKTSACL